jgi:hypothetical protein
MFKAIIQNIEKNNDNISYSVQFTDDVSNNVINKNYNFVMVSDIERSFESTIRYELKRLNDIEILYNSLLPIIGTEYEEIVLTSLEQAATVKINELTNTYNTIVNNGYSDTTANITLDLAIEGRNAFNQLVTDMFVLNDTDDTDITYIADKFGVISAITALDFKELMKRYAVYYKAIWGNLVMKKNAVMACVTIDEINLITW